MSELIECGAKCPSLVGRKKTPHQSKTILVKHSC